LLREVNAAYQRLKQNRGAWEEELQERRIWESTLGGGEDGRG
jgi:hypothetical protein